MLDIKKCFCLAKAPFAFIVPVLLTSGVLLGIGCDNQTHQKPVPKRPKTEDFNAYWFQGLAEISRFELEQARYGEVHRGDAVLIFVTEEFFTDKQVKSEEGKKPGAVSILKLNFLRKFNTGIYSYSIMSSLFTPVDRENFPQSLKVTTSIQEWCGHTFTQLNFRGNQYEVLVRSYLMDEGDRQYTMDGVQLEDDVWNLIRIAPDLLATGEINLIPGSQYSRLKRVIQKVQKATASLNENEDQYIYSIVYKEIPRKLVVKFKKVFPYEIMEWEETSASDRGADQSILTTRAIRTHILLIDYWNKSSVSDSVYRKELGLR